MSYLTLRWYVFIAERRFRRILRKFDAWMERTAWRAHVVDWHKNGRLPGLGAPVRF